MLNDFNQEQYDLIKKCEQLKDFSEWNSYIQEGNKKIHLKGADFSNMTFKECNFEKAFLENASFINSKIDRTDFSNCKLSKANFTQSEVSSSYFDNTDMVSVIIKEGKLYLNRFYSTNLHEANLQETRFYGCSFVNTSFMFANLKGSKFISILNPARILFNDGEKKIKIDFTGTSFLNALFNSETYFDLSNVSKETDFRTTTFHQASYSYGLYPTLQCINRQHNWNDWYEDRNILTKSFAKFFWWHTSYGYSISQLLKSFVLIIFLFSMIYYINPGLIINLKHYSIIQSVYFSFITMTTLGYGDMYPSHDSTIAQIIVIVQVCYGYILLGSLISLLSNLLSSDSPPQKVTKKTNQNLTKITSIKIHDIEK